MVKLNKILLITSIYQTYWKRETYWKEGEKRERGQML